jgi:uncharacterized protein (DUF1501 family)
MMNRRLFLQAGCSLPMARHGTWGAAMAATSALAATDATDYKALICVFLHGGNDAFNTVVATDNDAWNVYAALRRQEQGSLALLRSGAPDKTKAVGTPEWLGGVLPLKMNSTAPTAQLGLHPMLPDLQRLFNEQRRLAVLANVGPLAEPLSKQEYVTNTKRKPKKLFSHNDQACTWQALMPEGATVGWGGRMADILASSNQHPMFTSVSANGNWVWAAGQNSPMYQINPTGVIQMPAGRLYGSARAAEALQRIVGASGIEHAMATDLAEISRRSITASSYLASTLPPVEQAPFGPLSRLDYPSPIMGRQVNPLAQQLSQVARFIASGKAMGMRRQVFFVGIGGFDTHSNQCKSQAELLAQLNHGLAYLDDTLSAMTMQDNVTTFTCSDFGRSFTSNGDGTDHGWGSHHFIMGGAVKGGQVYGTLPSLGTKNSANNDFDSSPDQLTNGVLLPTTSVEQYGAILARWFGLSPTQLADVFPNLARFPSIDTRYFLKT